MCRYKKDFQALLPKKQRFETGKKSADFFAIWSWLRAAARVSPFFCGKYGGLVCFSPAHVRGKTNQNKKARRMNFFDKLKRAVAEYQSSAAAFLYSKKGWMY